MKRLSLFILAVVLAAGCSRGPSKLEIPSLIGDNMLIQQKTDVAVWGKAMKGHKIKVQPSWTKEAAAKAGEDMNWKVMIPAPEAGGPYTMKIVASDTTVTVSNILCGDVWFCSGQSNMEMPMAGWPPNDTIMHSKQTIASADINTIRLFILGRKVSGEPLDNCSGKWVVCTPETLPPFSATGFFFGKKLHDDTGLPIGLIESSWGGTPSEAWTSSGALESANEFVPLMKAIKESAPLIATYQTWLEGHKQQPVGSDADKWKNLDFSDKTVSSESFDDSAWPAIPLPSLFETNTGDLDGIVWFRNKFDLPSTYAGKDLDVWLGPIDDMDRTYINGELIGKHEESGDWQVERTYRIPGKLLKKGINTIAVRVTDTGGGGGIYGKKGSMKLTIPGSQKVLIDLGGIWKYQPVAELDGNKFYLFDAAKNDYFEQKKPVSIGPNSPATLYNGMVNPAKNYKIKGAIWYQGEANVGRSDQYAKIFPLMIRDWRETWKEGDFPFYFVQIAPYVYSGMDSTELAPLREAQTKALELPKTGMVVTLDIATVNNIHPPLKKEVGERLANLALANDYGKSIGVSGPKFKSMTRDGITLKIRFDNAGSGLRSGQKLMRGFDIAGKDGKFLPTMGIIKNDEVWVENPKIKEPVYVRYCWHNGDVSAFSNSDGLPAEQFSAVLNK
jgi:sialate O-acetylesterase